MEQELNALMARTRDRAAELQAPTFCWRESCQPFVNLI